MAYRSIFVENILRKAIYREAALLTKRGWHVMANYIPGYNVPPELEGYTPDIYALKKRFTLIICIATDAFFDSGKYTALKEYAEYTRYTFFRFWMVDHAGCRVNSSNNHTLPETSLIN